MLRRRGIPLMWNVKWNPSLTISTHTIKCTLGHCPTQVSTNVIYKWLQHPNFTTHSHPHIESRMHMHSLPLWWDRDYINSFLFSFLSQNTLQWISFPFLSHFHRFSGYFLSFSLSFPPISFCVSLSPPLFVVVWQVDVFCGQCAYWRLWALPFLWDFY